MAVGVAGDGGESRDHHIGAEFADDADDVGENALLVPDGEGLAIILGESEVDCAGEELACAVKLTGGKKFVGADVAQFRAKLVAQNILSAVAAGDGEIGGPIVAAMGEVGEELRVFIIRMSGDEQDAAHRIKGFQFLKNGGGVGIGGKDAGGKQ